MLKNKLKFLIPLSSFCLLISTPLVAASCRSDELTYDRYLLKSKTENGLDVLREHSPNFGSFSTESLWDTSSLFSILKQKHINDDNFKAKYSNEFKEIDQIKKQYYQNYNKFSDSEKKVM
ncbi:hypothetical protein [Ureaplasma diversum]|uniref:hypothetical protein n=1 Tax=Ureaplasma diversum TaxID=42094 RepID=UPI000A93E4D2|nr:hypothetical protein [Ureaplasma diversum]